MADMTHKHHILIADAINRGVLDFYEAMLGNSLFEEIPRSQRRLIIKHLHHHLVKSFVATLRYTHDKFDESEFKNLADLETPVDF